MHLFESHIVSPNRINRLPPEHDSVSCCEGSRPRLLRKVGFLESHSPAGQKPARFRRDHFCVASADLRMFLEMPHANSQPGWFRQDVRVNTGYKTCVRKGDCGVSCCRDTLVLVESDELHIDGAVIDGRNDNRGRRTIIDNKDLRYGVRLRRAGLYGPTKSRGALVEHRNDEVSLHFLRIQLAVLRVRELTDSRAQKFPS